MSRRIAYKTRYGRVIIESPTGTFSVGDSVVVKFEIGEEYVDTYVFVSWLDGNTDNPRTFVIEECGLSIYPIIGCLCQHLLIYNNTYKYNAGDVVYYVYHRNRAPWTCETGYDGSGQVYKPEEKPDEKFFKQQTKRICDICCIATLYNPDTAYRRGSIVYTSINDKRTYYICYENYEGGESNTPDENYFQSLPAKGYEHYKELLAILNKCSYDKKTCSCDVCDEYLIYMSLEELIGCKTTKYKKSDEFSCKEVVGRLEDILRCNNNTDNNNEN